MTDKFFITNKWYACIFYICAPLLFVSFVFQFPQYSGYWIGFSVGLLLHFIFFLKLYRESNLMLIIAIIPNALGPILSQSAFKLHGLEVSTLTEVSVTHALVLSSVLVLFIYGLIQVEERGILTVCLLGCAGAIYLLIMQKPTDVWFEGPEIFDDLSAPSISPLLLARVFVILICVFLAVTNYKEDLLLCRRCKAEADS